MMKYIFKTDHSSLLNMTKLKNKVSDNNLEIIFLREGSLDQGIGYIHRVTIFVDDPTQDGFKQKWKRFLLKWLL